MSKLRKKRTPQEKFKIVMEGLRGDHGSIAALCNAYGITQTDFYRWRDILMEDGSRLFERGGVDRERQRLEDENHKLREAVGSLVVELKKRLVMVARKRRVRQESPANVQLFKKIRALKCDHPSWGYKCIQARAHEGQLQACASPHEGGWASCAEEPQASCNQAEFLHGKGEAQDD